VKLFIPAVGYRIKLTEDWTFTVFYESRNVTLLEKVVTGFDKKTGCRDCLIDGDYNKGLKSVTASLPKSTLLEVDRVYVRTMNKSAIEDKNDYDSITFKVIGTQGMVRFWVKLADANTIEYELPEDFTAGKDAAKANAKKPKKLKPADIVSAVADTSHEYKGWKSPAWYTNTTRELFGDMAREYEKRQRPLDVKRSEKNRLAAEATDRHRFNNGEVSIPIALASVIKTYEDYKRHVPSYNHYGVNENFYKRDYFVPYTLLGHGYQTKCKFSRDEADQCVRRFSRKTKEELDSNYRGHREEADISDMWIEVVSNHEDTEIITVRGGFTPQETTP